MLSLRRKEFGLVALVASVISTFTVSAANMAPIAVTGFNRDVIIEQGASGPPFDAYAVELNPSESLSFYEAGLAEKSYGVPVGGGFTSQADNLTTFQFRPYTGNNALVLSSATGLSAGDLTLTTPQIYSRLAILANSASGGGSAEVTLHFTDGSSFVTLYEAPDWFNNDGYALWGVERIDLFSGNTQGAPFNPRFYQTTLDLTALLGTDNKAIASITFGKAPAQTTAIYAVSGEVALPIPAAIVTHPTNSTAAEATLASFSAAATGNPVPTLWWLRNGAPIVGAFKETYPFTAALADNNAVFRLVASNRVNNISYVVTSSPATLTVLADTNRPIALGAQSQGLTQVRVFFSERLTVTSANTLANYSLTVSNASVPITAVSLDASQTNVLLNAALAEGKTYVLTVNNLADQSATGNTVTNNSQLTFTASTYALLSVGNATPAGSQEIVANGLNLSGGGADLGGASDQFQFSYVARTGDFDVLVRVASLSLADAWAEAGMVVREDLSAVARGVSVMATPTISGCYFQARGTTNGATSLSGSFPANYPNTWLRLKRIGNDFMGYAGFDGVNWTQLGTANFTLPGTVFFGYAVSSHNPSQLATAAFRDFGTVTNAALGVAVASEPLGQSSRRTSLVISEIMYRSTNATEFVELFNTRGEPEDLSGYQLAGDIAYTFPAGTTLPGGAFLVVAKTPTDVQNTYGISGVLGPFTGSLPNGSGAVQLINPAGAVMLEVEYADEAPWPVAADGTGHSLVLTRPSYGENNPLAWGLSDAVGGSPGRLDPFTPDPLRNVVINEFLAHTDLPDVDYIELYNHSAQAVDVSQCILTDNEVVNKFVLPPGTVIPANGFVSFTETAMGFALSADGETIYFKNPDATRVLDAVRFAGQENGVPMGRFPNGGDQFYRLAAKTPGTNNAAILVSDVVINELMYHPITENDDDQYVELYNRTGSAVDLAGWTLSDGITFTFPPNTTIAPNGYLVVAHDTARFYTNYPNVNPAIVFGGFSGNLSGRSERVALAKPDSLTSTNGNVIVTNFFQIVVDDVTYNSGGRWGGLADGGGSSLELRDPRSNHRLAGNWAESDETQKAPWSIVSATGTIDNGNVAADQLQVLLQGAGECLIDNVQVLNNNVNLIANSTFEANANGWTAEGTEAQSGLETTEGYNSARSYHVRAVARGDNQVNRIRTPLTSSLASGTQNVTIRAAVRWLKGHPEILFRLRGNWLECAGEMALPISPGTPGARNSRFVTNAPPAIAEVQHAPVLPAASQDIVVTAKVEDPDGLANVTLKYRVDPTATYSTVVMNDTGTAGDAIARDGIYSGTIPGQAAGATVAFYVSSTDNFTPAATALFPNDAPARECLVRVGETQPTGNFPVYRIWMTQATLNTWASRNRLNNAPFDVTFVLGGQRVIYNAEALYAGSPYIAPGFSGPASGRCGYSIEMPKDDPFLGETDLVLDWPGGHGNETTAMQEQMGYWIADKLKIAYSHRYTIRLHVNGVTDDARQAVFEAAMQPSGAFLEQWVPEDPDGQFFKIDRAFEFNDGGGLTADPQPRLQNFTTTGGAKKREKYRWNFMYRASNRVNDYTGIFALVDALNASAPEPYTSATLGLVDVEQWMRIFATEHIIVNFDAYGHEIGKNMYAYKPVSGKWQLYMFDLDWLMLAAQSRGGGYSASSAPLFNSEDPTISTMYAFPPFARAYWRAIQDAVENAFVPEKYNAVLDAKYQSLVANGIQWCDGSQLTGPAAVKTWFNQRRTYLQNQLATVAAPFAVNPTVTISNGVGVITGTAPVNVGTIMVNGQPWTVRWTSVNSWIATIPLQAGSNFVGVAALDINGQPINGASNTVSVTYNGAVTSPVNAVVINEIMAHSATPDAEYIELFNTATNVAFDLSGWEFNGLSYTFPGGSVIAPRSYLVLARDRTAFNTAYGAGSVFDAYSGNLQANGETLSLLKPGPQTNQPVVVDRVRYEPAAPWPLLTDAVALQLRDAAQDNSRVGNWAVGQSAGQPPQNLALMTYTNGWRYMQVSNLDGVNWTASAFNDAAWPAGPGLLGFENNADITPLILTVLNDPRTPVNNAVAGHAYYFRTKLVVTNNLAGFTINASAYVDDGAVFYVNGVEAARVRMAGTVTNTSTATGQPSSGDATSADVFTIPSSFFISGTNVIAVEVHQNVLGSSDIVFGLALEASFGGSSGVATATPGALNSVAATQSPFAPLWLNELQADNQTGPLDNFSQREPWIELYNAGPTNINLGGYFLSDNYTNLAQWAFPSNLSVSAGSYLVVWCDNQPGQTAGASLHTNFRLGSGNGRVALSRQVGGTNQVMDYLTYTELPSNWSYGDVPDGQPFYRANMFYVTPNAANNGASAPITIFINEWLADNTRTLLDPADNNYEDWFELYNPGTNAVDLGGYYLTDNLVNKTKYLIPANGHYKVPAKGFLLVWADDESAQNSTNLTDLHAGFALGKGGEAIGLFAADGTQIDAVTFGAQTSDVSEGRFPDGSATIRSMTTPTPRAANTQANTAPSLATVADQEVFLGQTLILTAAGSDTDVPAQTLTYTLEAGAPAGAAIHAVTGAFSWKPTVAPGTNFITVTVTDNGVPNLFASRTFRVVVSLPPALGVQVNGSQMQLNWPRGTLQEANEAIGPYQDVIANPPFTVNFSETRKFYRLRL